jgi:hypothetical protein
LWRCSIFLVEHVEGRQADVGDFFLAERNDLTRRAILRLDIRYRSSGRSGRAAAGNCQRHSGDAEHGYYFIPTLALRSAFRLRHEQSPPLNFQ